MQVYVVGSLEPPILTGTPDEQKKLQQQFDQEKPQFTAACRALGYALVKAGHTVRVGLSQWSKLESGAAVSGYVYEGVNEAGKELSRQKPVIFDVPLDSPGHGASRMLKTLKELPWVDPKFKPLRVAPSGVSLTQDIDQADAFILVGGGTGTDRIGYAAYQIQKPVVAVTSFGRAAEAIHRDLLHDTYGDELAPAISAINADWASEGSDGQGLIENRRRASDLVKLTEKVASSMNARNRQGCLTLGATVAVSCLLLIAWVALYLLVDADKLNASIVFFALLFISAAIGTGLRVLVDYQGNVIVRLSGRWVVVELTIALMLAFGLALIYLIGGISFTGSVVVLNPTGDSENTFSTVALSMSLLGIAAGYLVPVEKLRERLEKVIEERQEESPG